MFEELEQIPWSELTPRSRRPRPLVVLVVIGALAVVVFGVRRGSSPLPVESTTPTPPVVAATESTPESGREPVSEADLRAETGAGELLAMGTAVVEVRRRSTTEQYVEWAVAEGLTSLGPGLWSVQVAFQILSTSGPDGLTRSAVRRLDVPVRVEGDVAHLAGYMTPSSYRTGPAADEWSPAPDSVTPATEAAVAAVLTGWGDVQVREVGRSGDLQRVIVEVEGMELAVWLRDGEVIDGIPVPERSQSNALSRIRCASGAMSSQDASDVFEIVTKSAVMKRLVTPSSAKSGPAKGSSSCWPATKVSGPPTGLPTVNLSALGLGVGSIMTGMTEDGTG